MNWGKGIVLAFICFATFIGYMVTRAFQEEFDLVTENHYAREINFQEKLVKLANTASSGMSVKIKQELAHILIEFPDKSAEGTIEFYHPSREIFDKTFAIDLKDGAQRIAKTELISGNYRVNINWQVKGQDFLQESKIFIR